MKDVNKINSNYNYSYEAIKKGCVEGSQASEIAKDAERQVAELGHDVAQLETTKLNATKSAVASVGGLVTPSVQLASNELTGVGTNGEQIRIQLGEGITLEGTTSPYTLKASGGSKLYVHSIHITASDGGYLGSILSSDSEVYNYQNICSKILLYGVTMKTNVFPSQVSVLSIITGAYSFMDTEWLNVAKIGFDGTISADAITPTASNFTDTVTEI